MLIKKRWILAPSILLFLVSIAFGQISGFDKVGTTSFTFLQVIPNARIAAMGGVYSAPLNSSEAVFFNPAGLTDASDLSTSISYLDWFLDTNISSLSMNFRAGQMGIFGVQIMYVNIGEIEETRVDHLYRDEATGFYNPGLTGSTFTPNAFVAGLSFARNVTDRFAFGITAKYVRESLYEKSASAIIFDGGVIYRTGFRSLILNTVIRNFGPEITYHSKGYPLPQTFSIGVSGYLFAPENAIFLNVPKQNLLVIFDLAQTRDHSQQQHLGFEYGFNNLVFLRGGYKFNFDEEAYTFGFGLNVYRFRLDYAYNNFGEYLSNVHRFTFGFDIK